MILTAGMWNYHYKLHRQYRRIELIWLGLACINMCPCYAPRTTVCLAGEDYAIAAGCTRMSTGYEILSRNQTKLFEL